MTYPARMTTKQLAECWKVTPARISQLVSDKKLSRGSDDLFDRDAAFSFRASQLDENQARALFQTYGNASGQYNSKVMDHLESDDEPTADEILGLAPWPRPKTKQDVLTAAVASGSRLTTLRADEQELRIERMKQQQRRQDGLLIERRDVYRAAQEAAGDITTMLNTLEHDIAALFDDFDMKADVRARAGRIVDRCLFGLNKKFAALAKGETDEDDDV